MDDRKPGLLQHTGQFDTKQVSGSTWMTLFFSLLFGFVLMAGFLPEIPAVWQGTFYFTLFFLFLSLILVIEFTNTLLDANDNRIILPKPVHDKTLTLARLLHIFMHLTKISVPMSLPSVILVGFLYNPLSSLLLLVSTFLFSLSSLAVISSIYLLLLRILKPEKFKNIINSLQILMVVVVYGSMQLLPGSIPSTLLDENTTSLLKASWLPPLWFSGLWDIANGHAIQSVQWLLALLAVLSPFAGFWIILKYLAPAFNSRLSLIAGSSNNSNTIKQISSGKLRLANIFTQPGPERMGFAFAWKNMLRTREFKLALYPGIGYMLVMAGISVFRMDGAKHILQIGPEISAFNVLAYLYGIFFLPFSAVSLLHMSPHFKAAWMFRIAPVAFPGRILKGALKAVFAQFYLIPIMVATCYGLWVNGLLFLPHLLFAVSCQAVLITGVILVARTELPFTMPLVRSGDAYTISQGILSVIFTAILVAVHWLLFQKPFLLTGLAGALLIAAFFLTRQISNMPGSYFSIFKKEG